MANEADEADSIIEANLQIALQNARRQVHTHPFTGLCRNCSDHIDQGAFCPGGECRDDYMKRAIFNR
jgi:hypothetical protein